MSIGSSSSNPIISF